MDSSFLPKGSPVFGSAGSSGGKAMSELEDLRLRDMPSLEKIREMAPMAEPNQASQAKLPKHRKEPSSPPQQSTPAISPSKTPIQTEPSVRIGNKDFTEQELESLIKELHKMGLIGDDGMPEMRPAQEAYGTLRPQHRSVYNRMRVNAGAVGIQKKAQPY